MKYDLRIGELKLIEPGFISFKFKQCEPYPAFKEYKQLVELELELCEDKPFVILADIRDVFGTMDKESKELIATHKRLNELKCYQAYLVNSLPIKLMLKGYLSFYKPNIEYKIFTDEEKALSWLREKLLLVR